MGLKGTTATVFPVPYYGGSVLVLNIMRTHYGMQMRISRMPSLSHSGLCGETVTDRLRVACEVHAWRESAGNAEKKRERTMIGGRTAARRKRDWKRKRMLRIGRTKTENPSVRTVARRRRRVVVCSSNIIILDSPSPPLRPPTTARKIL